MSTKIVRNSNFPPVGSGAQIPKNESSTYLYHISANSFLPWIVSPAPFNSFRGNYSIYEVKNLHNVETRYVLILFETNLTLHCKSKSKEKNRNNFFLFFDPSLLQSQHYFTPQLLNMQHPPNECWRRIWMALHCKYVQFLIVFGFHCNFVVRFTFNTIYSPM